MSTVGRSLELAREVLADGYTCDDALAEWMSRMQAEGLRYCPLAQEQIVLSCIDEQAEEPAPEFPEELPEPLIDEPVEGSLVIPELEVEPTPEELAAEQGKLPPAPAPVETGAYVVQYSYQSAPPGQRDASTLHEGRIFRGDLAGAMLAYDVAVAFGWPTEFAVYELLTGKRIADKVVNP